MSLLNLSHDSTVTIIMRALSCLTINTIVRDLHGHLDYMIELEETENMAVCPVHLARPGVPYSTSKKRRDCLAHPSHDLSIKFGVFLDTLLPILCKRHIWKSVLSRCEG